MASESVNNLEKFKSEGHTAFVLGYTGETGKALVKDLNQLKPFKKVVLIGRREVTLDPSFGPEFEQKVVDFENLEASRDVFKGLDVGFSCLGTTYAKSGTSGYMRVDHDYVLNAANIAKGEGCQHFSLVSSKRASNNSMLLFFRIKAKVEEDLKEVHFNRLSIFRADALMCNRQESRPGEFVARMLLKPVAYFFPTAMTTPVEVLSRSMINNAIAAGEPFELYDNKAIHQLSGISSGCKKKNVEQGGETSKAK